MTPKISEIKIIFLVCFFIVIIIVELIREPSSPNWAEKQANAWLEEQIAIICAESEEKEACIESLTKALEIPEETEKFIAAMEKKLGGLENVYQKTDEEMRELRREYEAELAK